MVRRRQVIRSGVGAIGAAVGAQVVSVEQINHVSEFGPGEPKHVVLLVLDRSGSMLGLREAVVAEVNAYLDQQRDKSGMFIGLVQFDDQKTRDGYCSPIFDFTAAATTPRLTPPDYVPRGATPLLAAIAEAVGRLEQVVQPRDRALLVIQTDGLENASPPEITFDVIRDLIESKRHQGWTVVFMGADLDAWDTSASLGITAGNTLGYAITPAGTAHAYRSASLGTSAWYASTGSGLDAVETADTPANTDRAFFTDSDQISPASSRANKRRVNRETTPKEPQ